MVRKYTTSDELLAIEQHGTDKRIQRINYAAHHRQRGLMVVMEDVVNPHNLAAIARSCDAFGIQQIAFTTNNDVLFEQKLEDIGMVSSSSASKWLDYRIFEGGTRECLTTLQSEGWHVLATVAGDDVLSLYDADLTQYDKLAILVGNERRGISQMAIDLADSHITIPMYGMIRSFNVSVATAITLSEITRQRDVSETDFRVSDEEATRIRHDFLLR